MKKTKRGSLIAFAIALAMVASRCAGGNAGSKSSGTNSSQSGSGAASASQSNSAAWKPTSSFKAFIGYGAGGSTDNVVRPLFTAFEKIAGQNVTVENLSGASGSISFANACEAAADGYNLIVSAEAACLYDAYEVIDYCIKDVQPLLIVGSMDNTLYVRADSPYQTVKELFDAELANPGSILKTASGTMGVNATLSAVFKHLLGVDFKAYTADSGTSAIVTVLGGFADWGISSLGSLEDYVENGDVRELCTLTTERIDENVPAITEFYPEMAPYLPLDPFYTISVSKDCPPEVVSYLSETLKQAWETPNYQDAMEAYNIQLLGLSGSDADQYIEDWRQSAFSSLGGAGDISVEKIESLGYTVG